jgi:phosphoribosylanthranilate isomerase
MIVQIYAVTSVEQALTMASLGVDHVGFVAGRYNQVHAEVSFDRAREMVDALRDRATSSALTMSTEPAEIIRMARAVQPDIVHISSDTEAVSAATLQQVCQALPTSMALMKAIDVTGPESIGTAQRFARMADFLLLDTKVAGFPGVGATGLTHDWQISRQIVSLVSGQAHVILAGGLTPENVEEAINTTNPWGVDSNTGTNIPGDPVEKDLGQVEAFVLRAKYGRPERRRHS